MTDIHGRAGVTELGEHPGAVDGPDAGLGQVDLSVRVLQKMGLHLTSSRLICSFSVISTAAEAWTAAA